MGVGIVEGPVQGADRLHPKLARLTKTRHLLQAEVGPQGRLDSAQEADVVLGRVVPVTRAFRPAAVGGEGSHGPNDRAPGMIDDLPCQVRLAIGDGERTRGQPAVAGLVPVVNDHWPSPSRLIDQQTRLQALFHDRLPDPGPVGIGQELIEPVVADRERIGHLGNIQEVGGIPIRERCGREHLLASAIGLAVVAVKAVQAGQRADSPQCGTALVKQPWADQPMDHHRLLDHLLRVFLQPVIPAPQARVDLDLLLDHVDFFIRHVKARMVGTKISHDLRGGAIIRARR